ncbi:hypothetical protein JCM10296v2_007423 [Rhodotorula toruloides]
MAETGHATIDTGLDATERTLNPPDAASAAHPLITSPRNSPSRRRHSRSNSWRTSLNVSRAFAATARPLIWREVVVQCENVVKSDKPPKWILPEPQYLSASHWNISSSGRKRLRILADRPDLSSLVQDSVVRPPNGIERSESAVIWSDDMGLIHSALDGMHNLVRLFAPSIVDLDKYPVTLPGRPHLRLQSLAVYSIARLERGSYHQDLTFFERCPNLVHLDFATMNLKMDFSTTSMLELLGHFSSALRRLDLDDLPAAPNCGGDVLPDLGSLSRLDAIHVTLRDHHARTNEYVLPGVPAEFLGADFTQVWVETREWGALATMLRWLNTLPRAEQLTLVFVLPPLAHPAMRKANKRFWQKFFGELRDSEWWDMRVPKLVKKVDWSAIFDEDEE